MPEKIIQTRTSKTRKNLDFLSKSKNKTLTNAIQSSSSQDLRVLSYNICWESTSGAQEDWVLCSNNTNLKNPKHNSVCISNIATVIDENNTDFVALQEANDYIKLIKLSPRLQKMEFKKHKSGLDCVVSFWDKCFHLIDKIAGAFEIGRPWLALFFSNGLCFINVHFGHYSTKDELYHLNNMVGKINKKIAKENLNVKRWIIAGDFNYDIKHLGKNGIIKLENGRFYYKTKHILTCCINRIKHYDHIIDTYSTPKDIFIPNVNYMSSDHKPVIAILKK